jgi:hypothetical protein
MIEVRTLLKGPTGFQPLTDAAEIIDPDYIEGALELMIEGKKLCGEAEWDLVDQLLCYFVQLIVDVNSNDTAHFYFPDQPIHVTCTVIAAIPDKSVTLQIGEKASSAIKLSELRKSLLLEAQRVLTLLQKRFPRNSYEDTFSMIRSLQ